MHLSGNQGTLGTRLRKGAGYVRNQGKFNQGVLNQGMLGARLRQEPGYLETVYFRNQGMLNQNVLSYEPVCSSIGSVSLLDTIKGITKGKSISY